MTPIQGLPTPAAPVPPPTSPDAASATEQPTTSFKDLLAEGIEQVNAMQQQADMAVQQMMTGDDVDPATVLTAVQKADMSFRLMMQIRNKLMQAYQEIKDILI